MLSRVKNLTRKPSWGTTCDINAIYTSSKSSFSGLQFRYTGLIFIRLAVIASETWKMSRNSERIWSYSSSRSSKWVSEQCFTSPPTQYRLYGRRIGQKTQPGHPDPGWQVIDLGVNGKPICDFLLVINIVNLAVSATVFVIFTLKDRKLLILLTPPLFHAP